MSVTKSGASGLRAIAPALAVAAILAGGVVWSGCGSSNDTSESSTKAQKEIEGGVKKAEEGLKEGGEEAKKGLETAKKQIEEGKGRRVEPSR